MSDEEAEDNASEEEQEVKEIPRPGPWGRAAEAQSEARPSG